MAPGVGPGDDGALGAAAEPAQVDAVAAALQDGLAARDAGDRRRGGARRPFLLGVDGRAGSGKTTLAVAVARRLGAPVLHMDDLYRGWDGLADAPAHLAEQVLAPLRRGRSGAYRRYDWAAGRLAERVLVPPDPVLVVEGCGTTVSPAGQLLDLRVWMDAAPVLRRRRGVARDGDVFAAQWERWAAQEADLFAVDGTPERADLRLCTDERR